MAPDDDAINGGLSQDDIDALLSGAGESADNAGTSPDGSDTSRDTGALSQDDLDAVLAEASDDSNVTPDQSSDTGGFSQDEIDALLAGGVESKTEPAEDEPADSGGFSQDEIDALLAGGGESPPDSEDSAGFSQDDIDALLAGEEPDVSEPETQESAAISQDDIDALLSLNTASNAEGAPPPPENDEPMGQDAIDALLAGDADADENTGPVEDVGALSQDDIDALLGGDAEKSAQPTPEAESASAAINQEDIDALIAGDSAPADTVPPEPDAVPITSEDALAQDDINALLGGDADEPIPGTAIDEPIQPADDDEDGAISQDDIDALIAAASASGGLSDAPSEPQAETGGLAQAAPPLTPEMISDIVGEEADDSALISENLAAAAPAADNGLISQDDIDALISQASSDAEIEAQVEVVSPQEVVPVPDDGALELSGDVIKPTAKRERKPVPTKVRKKRKPRRPSIVLQAFRRHPLRFAASFLVAVMASASTFYLLYNHRNQVPAWEELTTTADGGLNRSMAVARNLMASNRFEAAADVLTRSLDEALPNAMLRNDARFMRLEAQMKALPPDATARDFEPLHGEIDRLVLDAPTHPRAPEALLWKAQLYERDDMPSAARGIYQQIVDNYASAEHFDEILFDSAKNDISIRRFPDAVESLDWLIEDFPGSPLIPRAKLLLAGALENLGQIEAAEALYADVATTHAGTPLAGEAFAQLGEAALAEGDFEKAIALLETQLETALTVEPSLYLALARAYRAAGRLEDARNTLNDMLNFMPDSDVKADAYIEQSQVLDELGRRREAGMLASQAAQEFPNNPDVLKNKAELLIRAGNTEPAAYVLVEAEKASANDPALLIQAGRYFQDHGEYVEAYNAYKRVLDEYPDYPQAFVAGTEQGRVLYALKKTQRAIDHLENMAQLTRGGEYYLPVLQALSAIYSDLGLSDSICRVNKEMASLTKDPALLAQNALALLKNGATRDGLLVANTVAMNQVPDRTAYALLVQWGEALLPTDSRRALEKLEDAYYTYPEQRTDQGDLKLLETYLATGRSAQARALVMDVEARSRTNPAEATRLQRAAVKWGDYLFRERDYRAAADAYELALSAPVDAGGDRDWARYQRANALLSLEDLAGSIRLYDEIRDSTSPWAREAEVKATYARLEQQLRGLPATESEGS